MTLIDSRGAPLVQRLQAAPPVPMGDGDMGALVSMIERVARDPTVDIGRIERLYELRDRELNRQARAAYAADLAEMQPSLPIIQERGAITDQAKVVKSTYALWEDINAAILPILSAHGFSLSFRTGRTPEGQIQVTGVLTHRMGHFEETTLVLPVDSSGSKNAVQAVGSSTSYGKRYTAGALLNFSSTGEDDDGQAGGSGGARGMGAAAQAAISTINLAETVEQLRAWRAKNEAGLDAFDAEERRTIVGLYTKRLAALKGGAA